MKNILVFSLSFIILWIGCETQNMRKEKIERFYLENKNNFRRNDYFNWTFNRREAGSNKCFLFDCKDQGFYVCRNNNYYLYDSEQFAYTDYLKKFGRDSIDLILFRGNKMIEMINKYDLFRVFSGDTSAIYYYFNKNDVLIYAKKINDELFAAIKHEYPNYSIIKKFDNEWIWIKTNKED